VPSGRSVLPAIFRVWLAATFIISCLLIFRSVANQPCATPVACILPSVYLAWKPLLILFGVAVVGRALISTVRILR
jgi:hypothetical protein